MGKIISIVNNKGGAGKTTAAANLSAALAKRGRTVLGVDIDTQCNLTLRLLPKDAAPQKGLFELLDPSDQQPEISACIYPSKTDEKIQLIPNVPETGNLEFDFMQYRPDSYFVLRKRLRNFAMEKFDYTIIDCPPNMGAFVFIALFASDFVIVPIEASSSDSILGLRRAVDQIQSIREFPKGNPDLNLLRILINKADRRTVISNVIIEKIHKEFKNTQVFKTIIPVNTAFARAESLKETIFESEPTSPGANAFRSLAKEVIEIVEGIKIRNGRK